jgi:hypothetical protein
MLMAQYAWELDAMRHIIHARAAGGMQQNCV